MREATNRLRVGMLVALVCLGCLSTQRSVAGRQVLKIAGEDLAGFDPIDNFGDVVAIDGGLAAVSTFLGQTFVVDVATGELVSRLMPSRQYAGSWDVAIEGETVLVGDIAYDQNRGAGFVYDAVTGVELSKLVPDVSSCADDAGDCLESPDTESPHFGFSVDVSDGVAVVGWPSDGAGAVYLFDVDTGQQISKLSASDGQPGDSFGFSVAIDEGVVLVGSPNNQVAERQSGAVYAFDARTGEEIGKHYPADIFLGQGFGVSVELDAATAVVSMQTSYVSFSDAEAGVRSAAAYIVDLEADGSPTRLTVEDSFGGDDFGEWVAIDEDLVLVGDRQAGTDINSHQGAAYVFDRATGRQLARLTALDSGLGASFGTSVALEGDTAVITALLASDSDEIPNGTVYVFDLSVPEPAAAVLAVVAGAAVVTGQRRGLPGGAAGSSAALAGSAARG